MSVTSPSAKRDPAGGTGSLFRWQGVFGPMRRRPVLSVAIVLLSLGLTVAAGYFIVYPECLATYYWWQAEKASEQYDFRQAREHLARCLEIWKRSGETHFAMARACRRDGDFVAARRYLQLAKRLDWSPHALDLEHKLIQAQSGQVRPVEKYLKSLVAADHDDKLLIIEALVLGYLRNNYLDDAYRWLSIWIDMAPKMWQPHLLRGQALERAQKHRLAIEEYRRALELAPDRPDPHFYLAKALLKLKEFPEAKEHYQAYLRDRPDDADALVGLARCYRNLRQLETAKQILDQMLQKHPKHASGLLLRGQLAWDMEQPEEALKFLRRSAAQAPMVLETNQMLATVLRDLGRNQEAEKIEQRRAAIENDLRRIEDLVKELNELESSVRDVKTGTITDPSRKARVVELRYQIGSIVMRVGQPHDAIGWFISALQEDPSHKPSRKAISDYQKKLMQSQRRSGEPVAATGRSGT